MPEPPSDSLFKLIKSLNPIEKRTITTFLNKGDQSQDLHLQLFHELNKMDEFDPDAEIAMREKDGTFATRKNYLFNTILKVLDQSSENDSRTHMIEKHIRYGQLLAERSLLKDAIAQIEKSEKLAVEAEMFGYLSMIYDIKKRTYQSLLPFSDYQKESSKIFKLRADLTASLYNYEQIKTAHSDYKLILTEHGSLNLPEDQRSRLIGIHDSTLFQDDNFPKTKHARILYHDIRAIHAVYFHNDFETGYKEYLKVYECINHIPDYQDQNIYDFLFYVSKVVYYGIHLDRYIEVEKVHDEIRQLYLKDSYKSYPFINSHVSQYHVHLEIVSIFKYGYFDKIEGLAGLIEDDFKRFKGLLQEETIIVTNSNVGITWLVQGSAKDSVKWFLNLVNGKYTVRQDILNATCIHLLMALIELNDYDLFERYYRSFSRKSHFMPHEEMIIKKMNAVFLAKNDQGIYRSKIEQVCDELIALMKSDSSIKNFNTTLMVYWFKWQISGTPLAELMMSVNDTDILDWKTPKT